MPRVRFDIPRVPSILFLRQPPEDRCRQLGLLTGQLYFPRWRKLIERLRQDAHVVAHDADDLLCGQ